MEKREMERDWMRRMEEMQKNEEATSKNYRAKEKEKERQRQTQGE